MSSVIYLTEKTSRQIFSYEVDLKKPLWASDCAQVVRAKSPNGSSYPYSDLVIKILNQSCTKLTERDLGFLCPLDKTHFFTPLSEFLPEASLFEKSGFLTRLRVVKIIATPFFDGCDLVDYREKYKKLDRSLSFSERETLFATLWLRLEELHSQGIVHGDIKPDNILTNSDLSEMIIIDFDFAHPVNSTTEFFQGSVLYMPPEVMWNHVLCFCLDKFSLNADNRKTLEQAFLKTDEKVDIWSALMTLLAVFSNQSILINHDYQDSHYSITEIIMGRLKSKIAAIFAAKKPFNQAEILTAFFQEYATVICDGIQNLARYYDLSLEEKKFFLWALLSVKFEASQIRSEDLQINPEKRPSFQEIRIKAREILGFQTVLPMALVV